VKATTPPSELEIRLHQFTDIAPERLAVRFDFEVVASREITALEVQVSIWYADIMGEWVNLDLRQYEMVEVEKGKGGQAVRRISLLAHASQRFTLVTFFFRPATPKTTTIKVVDQSKQVNFTDMKWISPYPRINAKFVGLENEIEKQYIIVFNKPPEGLADPLRADPVELLELGSDKAKQLLAEYDQVRAEFRREREQERLQTYAELLQIVTEIEHENPVRPGGMVSHATGSPGLFPLRIHKDTTNAITKIVREKRIDLADTTAAAWNDRRIAMRYAGRSDLENLEDVYLDDFIADVKQNYERLKKESSQH
jgi:hypothetical protein